ncbi:MAG: class I SAM-dependent methyltransferase [Pirellulales bacterium]
MSSTISGGQFRLSRRGTRPVEWETVNCPACGCGDFIPPVWPAATDLAAAGCLPSLVRCQNCELTFTNPRPIVRDIGHFYPPEYGCHDVRGNWDTRRRARWRRRLEGHVLRAFFNYPPQPAGMATLLAGCLGRVWIRSSQHRAGWIEYQGAGSLLDFGCGAGSFLRRMQAHGWHVEGLDVSAAVARRVQRQTGIRVHVGSLPHGDLKTGSFDCITMWQSLEHVHQPRRVLESARELLRPGGTIVVLVPNLQSWSFRVFGPHWFALDLPRHLTHFTPVTLARLLQTTGFHVRRSQQVAIDGWIRQSARQVAAAGHRQWLSVCRWKPLALAVARWTERRGMADNVLVVAERE